MAKKTMQAKFSYFLGFLGLFHSPPCDFQTNPLDPDDLPRILRLPEGTWVSLDEGELALLISEKDGLNGISTELHDYVCERLGVDKDSQKSLELKRLRNLVWMKN